MAAREASSLRKTGWAFAVATGLLLAGAAALPPFVAEPVRGLLHQAFAPVCHQMPARAFAVGGVPFAVCHRCFGIYAGLLAGALVWPLLGARARALVEQRTVPLVLVFGAPAGIDWALGVAGVWANTPLTQAASGALLGSALGAALAGAAAREHTAETIRKSA